MGESVVSIVGAVASLLGALFVWFKAPRPDFVILSIYVDDNHWHSREDAVTAVIGVQNQGTGPARKVTLERTLAGQWMKTSASDRWAIIAPGQSVQINEGNLVLDETKGNKNYMSGVAGLAEFNGLKVRIRWSGDFGIRHSKTWDIDEEHAQWGRAPRLDPTLTPFPQPFQFAVTSAPKPGADPWRIERMQVDGHFRLINETGTSAALQGFFDVNGDVPIAVDFEIPTPLPMGLSPAVGLPFVYERPEGSTAVIRFRVDWIAHFGDAQDSFTLQLP